MDEVIRLWETLIKKFIAATTGESPIENFDWYSECAQNKGFYLLNTCMPFNTILFFMHLLYWCLSYRSFHANKILNKSESNIKSKDHFRIQWIFVPEMKLIKKSENEGWTGYRTVKMRTWPIFFYYWIDANLFPFRWIQTDRRIIEPCWP